MNIEIGNLTSILTELEQAKAHRTELQDNQTKLMNEARANDISCQLRKEFEQRSIGERAVLLSEFDDTELDGNLLGFRCATLAEAALDLAMRDRANEAKRLRSGIPRSEVARIVHDAILAGTSREDVLRRIDGLLREGGYRGR